MIGPYLGAWIRARQAAIYQREFERGFGWAMAMRHLHSWQLSRISSYCIGETAFNRGAMKAALIIATELRVESGANLSAMAHDYIIDEQRRRLAK
jgi:hypothetical protein